MDKQVKIYVAKTELREGIEGRIRIFSLILCGQKGKV